MAAIPWKQLPFNGDSVATPPDNLTRISHHDSYNQPLTTTPHGFQRFLEKTVCFLFSISPKACLASFYSILGWTCEKFGSNSLPLLMGRYPITRAQWCVVAGDDLVDSDIFPIDREYASLKIYHFLVPSVG
jgi:hypothetical protein